MPFFVVCYVCKTVIFGCITRKNPFGRDERTNPYVTLDQMGFDEVRRKIARLKTAIFG